MVTIENLSFDDIVVVDSSCDLIARRIQFKMDGYHSDNYIDKQCVISFSEWISFEARSVGLIKHGEFIPCEFRAEMILDLEYINDLVVISVMCQDSCYYEFRIRKPFVSLRILEP